MTSLLYILTRIYWRPLCCIFCGIVAPIFKNESNSSLYKVEPAHESSFCYAVEEFRISAVFKAAPISLFKRVATFVHLISCCILIYSTYRKNNSTSFGARSRVQRMLFRLLALCKIAKTFHKFAHKMYKKHRKNISEFIYLFIYLFILPAAPTAL